MGIEELRRNIETTDFQILELIRKRTELAGEIGKLKRDKGMEIRNPEVEAAVTARYAEFASANGLDPAMAESVAKLLIGEAVRKEKEVIL